MKKCTHGFTLLEILVAMFILLIIASIIASGIHTLATTQETLTHKNARLAQAQLAIVIIKNDIRQMTARPILNTNGNLSAAFLKSSTSLTSDRIEFTHMGLVNPAARAPRSTLQRVAYELKGTTLTREIWPVLDRTPNTTSEAQLLLEQVESFRVEPFYTTTTLNNNLPDGIEIKLQMKGLGHIDLIIPVGK